MITSNSARPHHVDTRLDYVRPNPLHRAWRAARRAVLMRWYRWQLDCLLSEREGYLSSGVRLGPQYLRECAKQARVLRGQIAFIECDLL